MLSMAVCIAVLAIAAGYTVGVVSQNNVIAQIDVNIGSIETYLEKNHNATQLLTDEFKEDYSAKTRTIAMLLAQDSSFIQNRSGKRSLQRRSRCRRQCGGKYRPVRRRHFHP